MTEGYSYKTGKIHKAVIKNGRLIPACQVNGKLTTELDTGRLVDLTRECHGHSQDCKKCFPTK